MEFFSILLPLSLAALLLSILYKNKYNPKTRIPPGPPTLPFIGNLHQIDVLCLHKYLWQLSKRYGPLMLLKLGAIPTLVISSARLAEESMKRQDLVFCSRPRMVGQLKLSYNALDIAFGPYNQEWRETRKIAVVHLLSTRRIHQFRPIREDEVLRMVEKIGRDVESGNATNLTETLISTTSTNICRIAFGKRLDADNHQRRKLESILKSSQEMFMGFFFSDYFPSVGWIDHLTGMFSRLEKTFQEADSFYQELIDEHLDPNRPSTMDDDIIDIMLQLQRDRSMTSFDITMDHIKAMLMNVFLGGTETIVTTVIWAMTALMKNPSVMNKLQAEIREAMGKKAFLDEDDVQNLPYLSATIKESMRLYPTVPLLLPRVTMEKCNLDGYEIPANTMVYVNAWSIGRDPTVWENADEFSPDRFLDSDIDLKGQDFELIPFGAGRRGCPGLLMGLVTVHLLLANLLHSYDWEFPHGMTKEDLDTESLPGLALTKKNALNLVARIASS